MKSILAFGDSNTWGLIPGSNPQRRYPYDVRWTGVLQNKRNDLKVIEEGLCGRTTVFEDRTRKGRKGVDALPAILKNRKPVDIAIIMLGTNDCKTEYAANPEIIGQGMEKCLDKMEEYLNKDRILLISPIALGNDVWRPEKDPEFDVRSVETSRELKAVYEKIARKRGIHYLAASDHVIADPKDDEHFSMEGHRAFADAVFEKINEMNLL
ncbi:MAG: arylesterase [Lachnospiraceae bacterium]|nr:arylesterase [Lachnospiraceae bacterium]